MIFDPNSPILRVSQGRVKESAPIRTPRFLDTPPGRSTMKRDSISKPLVQAVFSA